MKQTKQRVVALDYFRGICILVVVLNHAAVFSMPFTYFVGAGRLWTGAAEMFFLLSGITFGVVRMSLLESDFRGLIRKSWLRATNLYVIYLLITMLSLLLAYFFVAEGLTNDVIGALPVTSGIHLLIQIMNLSYSIGWANFLMFYAVFLVLAPFMLYILKTRLWPVVLLVSSFLYLFPVMHINLLGPYTDFSTWQLYFVLGLCLARFRARIFSWYHSLPHKVYAGFNKALLLTAGAALSVSILLEFNISPIVSKLANGGWLPVKLESAYIHLLNQRQTLNQLLINQRIGLLRPLAAMLFMAAAYILYQRYRSFLLRRTGVFINAMGRNTLWIFVAQALAIPLLAALPINRNVITNTLLTAILIYSMWLIANRREVWRSLRSYSVEFKTSYNQAKYSYLNQRYEDN